MTADTKAVDKKTAVRRAARGTKRTCQNSECESRFYDLNRDPIQCPICNATYVAEVAPPPPPKPVVAPAPAKPAPVVDANAVDEDAEDIADIKTDGTDDSDDKDAKDANDANDDIFLERDDDDADPAVAGIVGTTGKDAAEDN